MSSVSEDQNENTKPSQESHESEWLLGNIEQKTNKVRDKQNEIRYDEIAVEKCELEFKVEEKSKEKQSGRDVKNDALKTQLKEEGNTVNIFEKPEKLPSLAEAEITDEEHDLERSKCEIHLRHNENYEISSCKECFDILENSFKIDHDCLNDEVTLLPSTKNSYNCDVKILNENSVHQNCNPLLSHRSNEGAESCYSSRHSLSQSCQSLATTRNHSSKHSLTLDLECRICHDTEGQDLISPCHCAGTSKWVHESCIIRWIKHAKAKECEICTCPIKVKKKKKPIDQWTRPTATCGPCNKLDIWYCFVVFLCIFIIISFVVLQHRYDVTDQIETTVIFASIYVLCGMIIMMKVRYFWNWFTQRSSFWGNWKNLNEEWRIIEAMEPNVSSPVSPV